MRVCCFVQGVEIREAIISCSIGTKRFDVQYSRAVFLGYFVVLTESTWWGPPGKLLQNLLELQCRGSNDMYAQEIVVHCKAESARIKFPPQADLCFGKSASEFIERWR